MLRKAEEALQTTKRVMNPWEIWLWPWIAGSALTRRALETHGSMEASNGDAALPRVSEPEWASPNHVTIELDAASAGQRQPHRLPFELVRKPSLFVPAHRLSLP
jgi:hypothetical protein